jgi:hypothetical protein
MQSATIKALALNRTGAAMKEIEIACPTPATAANEVLVQVAYSAIDTSLASIINKCMASGCIHDMKVKTLVAGYHFADRVTERNKIPPY